MEIIKNITQNILNIVNSSPKKNTVTEACNISIGITTFGSRFDRYFVPLLAKIKEYSPEIEVVVAINGEHRQEFDEGYRRQVLEFISRNQKVYPVLFPQFRGLAKLWNTIIINASSDYVLMLNDDIMISDPSYIDKIRQFIVKNEGRSFLINRSWSHFLVNREEIDELGYFDERLLGIGEEDGDMTWRYLARFGREISSFKSKNFINYAEDSVNTYKPVNIQCHSGSKYSLFNRNFMFKEKYHPDPAGIKGMFIESFSLKNPGKEQYPNERFYKLHKNEL